MVVIIPQKIIKHYMRHLQKKNIFLFFSVVFVVPLFEKLKIVVSGDGEIEEIRGGFWCVLLFFLSRRVLIIHMMCY